MRLAAVGFAALLAVSACSSPRDGTVEPPVAPGAPGDGPRAVTLAVGDTFNVVLRANRTTGYDWAATVPSVLAQMGEARYVTDASPPGAPPRVGAGGTMTWRFRAARPGRGDLDFAYRRPWEHDTPPAQTVHYDVTVTGE